MGKETAITCPACKGRGRSPQSCGCTDSPCYRDHRMCAACDGEGVVRAVGNGNPEGGS